jgi:hypothetical protein
MKKFILSLFILAVALPVQAQTLTDEEEATIQGQIALVRNVAGAQRQALVAENMKFSTAEAEAFWPLYRDYRAEVTKVNDGLFALIKQYADNQTTMASKMAEEMTKKALAMEEKRFDLKEEYVGKFGKVIPGVKVFRLMQIENRISAVYALKLASEIPLME